MFLGEKKNEISSELVKSPAWSFKQKNPFGKRLNMDI